MEVVTREQVRKKVVAKLLQLKASFTDFPVEIEWENRDNIDLTTQQKPYISFAMIFQDGEQVGLGPRDTRRVMGTLLLAVLARKGSGTEESNKIVDHFFRPLSQTDELNPLRLTGARFSSSPSVLGWVSQGVLVPFWYDTL